MISLDFKKIISYFKGHKEKEIFDKSLRDWKILIILFSVIILVLWAVDGYIYSRGIKMEEDLDFMGDERFETVNKTLLSEVIKSLDTKENRIIENFSAPNISDPSI